MKPGLNFILADDNNVGKSTIFKILTLIAKMPSVSGEDLKEILRVGESSGYASFEFDNERVTFWMFREDGNKIRAFFEHTVINESAVRSTQCPKSLLEALDIICGDDGQPINFNDADSVQLVVQDTSKNDEVLSKVLVDIRVEEIKQRSQMLAKQVASDYRVYQSRLQDSTHLLEQLTYNEAVDVFKVEEDFMLAATRVLDTLDTNCSSFTPSLDFTIDEDFSQFLHAFKIYNVLTTLTFTKEQEVSVSKGDVELLDKVHYVYQELLKCDCAFLRKVQKVSSKQVNNAYRAIKVLSRLNNASYSGNLISSYTSMIYTLEHEKRDLMSVIGDMCTIIDCPVKGKVFYSEDGCLPIKD